MTSTVDCKRYYVYAHSNDKYGIFYIGKGSGKRLYTTSGRNPLWKKIVAKYGYAAIILRDGLTEQMAYDEEVALIALYREQGQCAANFSNGGDGLRIDNRWLYHKVSAALTGISRPRGKESYSYKDFASYDELFNGYVHEGLSITILGQKYGVSSTAVWDRLKQLGIPVRDMKKRGKMIVCLDDGKEFSSIKVAARHYGIYRENIRKVLAGTYKSTGNLHFTYAEGQDL